MIDVLSPALTWVAVGAAVWALVLVLADRPLPVDRPDGKAYLGLLALIEVGLLAQAVLGFIKLATADHDVPALSYGGYLLGSLLILPVALYWSLAERTRWGTAVLVVGALVIPVMIVRLGQVWAHG
ncbi:hypothetical protein [Actinokineospora globicatena]|uniref:hypothetical protein n=1 Tax=Actinokineospora globicatena TaxID=103729 RepID=UPI0020A35928|nr:hypothetical protein [Actinokineospora globicatena]MCP2302287.1 hypothetical protein [Actinokineospora globicatena]GLW76046.1 hypothetical protein Aglo01_05280 [Actinokineospora globicatena]GLW82882.1 hypothetical protein Aglo02_05220 [Actinokineospora globicatena]